MTEHNAPQPIAKNTTKPKAKRSPSVNWARVNRVARVRAYKALRSAGYDDESFALSVWAPIRDGETAFNMCSSAVWLLAEIEGPLDAGARKLLEPVAYAAYAAYRGRVVALQRYLRDIERIAGDMARGNQANAEGATA